MDAVEDADQGAGEHARRLDRPRTEPAPTLSGAPRGRGRTEDGVRWAPAGVHRGRPGGPALASLTPRGWATAHHDVRWAEGARADVLVASGPGGVVVVDSRNWTGPVTVTGVELRHDGYPRTQEIGRAADAAAAVTALLAPPHRTAVRAVLCLTAQDVGPVTTASGVTVLGPAQLAPYLSGLRPRLTADDVADIGRVLTAELGRGDRPAPARTSARPVEAGAASTRPRRPQRDVRRRDPVPRAMLRVLFALLTLGWFSALVAGTLAGAAGGADDAVPPSSVPVATPGVPPTP